MCLPLPFPMHGYIAFVLLLFCARPSVFFSGSKARITEPFYRVEIFFVRRIKACPEGEQVRRSECSPRGIRLAIPIRWHAISSADHAPARAILTCHQRSHFQTVRKTVACRLSRHLLTRAIHYAAAALDVSGSERRTVLLPLTWKTSVCFFVSSVSVFFPIRDGVEF